MYLCDGALRLDVLDISTIFNVFYLQRLYFSTLAPKALYSVRYLLEDPAFSLLEIDQCPQFAK